jgi:energy-coupling factor transport system ATP-binding protein
MDIHLEAVSYAYPGGVAALRGVTLHIGSGERAAIIGQNGAGKTTLAKHLNGLLQPAAGRVTVGDWDTRQHSVSQMAARVGYVFQNPDDQLFKSSVWAEVIFGPKNLGWPAERADQHARQALELVGLSAAPARHPHDLSFSQRKNVALAAVLAMDTPIVILDEPTTGQDYAGQELLGQVVAWLSQAGKTVLAITHDIDFCAEHFERVVVMGEGQVLLDGPARQALAQYETLASTGVEPPQLVRLASRLGLGRPPLNVDEFIQEIHASHPLG